GVAFRYPRPDALVLTEELQDLEPCEIEVVIAAAHDEIDVDASPRHAALAESLLLAPDVPVELAMEMPHALLLLAPERTAERPRADAALLDGQKLRILIEHIAEIGLLPDGHVHDLRPGRTGHIDAGRKAHPGRNRVAGIIDVSIQDHCVIDEGLGIVRMRQEAHDEYAFRMHPHLHVREEPRGPAVRQLPVGKAVVVIQPDAARPLAL